MTPTATVTCLDCIIVVAIAIAIAITIAIAVVVTSGSGCNCGKYCGCEIVRGEGGIGVGDLHGDCRGFCDSGGEGGRSCREQCVGQRKGHHVLINGKRIGQIRCVGCMVSYLCYGCFAVVFLVRLAEVGLEYR